MSAESVPESTGSEVAVDKSESIERLFRDYNESLLRFLRARLHSTHEAHEVAQEAYAQLLGLGNPGAMSFLSAYLFRTAANLATNRLKQRSNRQRLDDMVVRETSDARSPEQSCAAQQDLDLLSRAIEELPPKCAKAFILVRFNDFDFNQAAEEMDLHPRQVRRLVARALEHCQSVLASQGTTREITQGSEQ